MANTFLNETIYANVMLLLVKNQLVMGKKVETKFSGLVTNENGLSVNVKRPPRFLTTNGPTFDPQDIVIGSENISVTEYKHVGVNITDLQYVQSYNELMRNSVMKSAASRLAQDIDSFLHTQLIEFPSWVQAPAAAGTVDYALATPQQEIPVWTRMENLSAPATDRVGVMATEDAAGIQGSLIDKFMTNEAVNALKKAQVPMLSDIDYARTQAVRSVTTGTRTSSGAAQIDGASQNVDYSSVKDVMTQTLNLKGLTNGNTIKAGEVFTIAGVYAINQMTQETLTYLQQFTVMSDVTVTGTQETVTIAPPIIVPGTGGSTAIQRVNTVFATCSAVPADSANVTWAGAASTTFRQRAAWHKSAIQMVTAQLITPFVGVSSFATDPETGISIRYWRSSDFTNATHGHRWDCIFGASNVDRMLGTRFSGVATS